MKRSLAMTVAAFVLAVPAMAAETLDSASLAQQQLAATSAALQARQHLVRQGYVHVSTLEQNANGVWTGTALKDGKSVIVGIKLPVIPAATN